jgi:hypothetical protein
LNVADWLICYRCCHVLPLIVRSFALLQITLFVLMWC